MTLGFIYMTNHQSAVYRAASCPGNPATCGSRTLFGRAGTTQGADVPPGQRDPALENVPCRVEIAVRHQTAAAAGKLAHTRR